MTEIAIAIIVLGVLAFIAFLLWVGMIIGGIRLMRKALRRGVCFE